MIARDDNLCPACNARRIHNRGICDACYMYYRRYGRRGEPPTARMRRIIEVIQSVHEMDRRNPANRLYADQRLCELRDEVLRYATRHPGRATWRQAWELIGRDAGFPEPGHFREAIRRHEQRHHLRKAIQEVRAIMGRKRTVSTAQ